nr:MAG TPA: hypothetical protein [Caudoviricetes sp.]
MLRIIHLYFDCKDTQYCVFRQIFYALFRVRL